MGKDTGKLWKLTKLLNGEIPEKAQTVLKSEGEYIVQKEAANCLAKLYKKRAMSSYLGKEPLKSESS